MNAADDPETARQAARLVQVDYESLHPLTDVELALEDARRVHPDGNLVRHVKFHHGDLTAAREQADLVVTGEYEVGMQDQECLGPESGLALPTEDGGVELYVSSQAFVIDFLPTPKGGGVQPSQVGFPAS
ncbi:molybdopterin cofactor-binding domain-containing protein [Saccharopolyspora hattusasensis]|uniref:molybdopterin cofactor-binding domain-containing protein n=1 Tax=Saccharopolyspora hattusasensis TaxID=1128679 RepID=UPI003D95EFB3